MKVQDIGFLVLLAGLVFWRRPKLIVIAALSSIVLSMPLFYLKVALFTAERLVVYAAGLFLLYIILGVIRSRSYK